MKKQGHKAKPGGGGDSFKFISWGIAKLKAEIAPTTEARGFKEHFNAELQGTARHRDGRGVIPDGWEAGMRTKTRVVGEPQIGKSREGVIFGWLVGWLVIWKWEILRKKKLEKKTVCVVAFGCCFGGFAVGNFHPIQRRIMKTFSFPSHHQWDFQAPPIMGPLNPILFPTPTPGSP